MNKHSILFIGLDTYKECNEVVSKIVKLQDGNAANLALNREHRLKTGAIVNRQQSLDRVAAR